MDRLIADPVERVTTDLQLVPFRNKEGFFGLQQARDTVSKCTQGLDIEVDRILEIACIITDGKLINSVEGPDLVIKQSKECLDNMGEWCREHHAASGLTERVLQSTITEKDAEEQVKNFVKNHVGSQTPLLAGNSVYVDFMFLKKYMPCLAELFPHVLVDVSSITALCMRWFPKEGCPYKEEETQSHG